MTQLNDCFCSSMGFQSNNVGTLKTWRRRNGGQAKALSQQEKEKNKNKWGFGPVEEAQKEGVEQDKHFPLWSCRVIVKSHVRVDPCSHIQVRLQPLGPLSRWPDAQSSPLSSDAKPCGCQRTHLVHTLHLVAHGSRSGEARKHG